MKIIFTVVLLFLGAYPGRAEQEENCERRSVRIPRLRGIGFPILVGGGARSPSLGPENKTWIPS